MDRRFVFDLVARGELLRGDVGNLGIHGRHQAFLYQGVVALGFELRGVIIGGDLRGVGFQVEPLLFKCYAQIGVSGLGGLQREFRAQQRGLQLRIVMVRMTLSGLDRRSRLDEYFSMRPSVWAGSSRVSSGTRVPRPRTSRIMGPRRTVSGQRVDNSTPGAAGFRWPLNE